MLYVWPMLILRASNGVWQSVDSRGTEAHSLVRFGLYSGTGTGYGHALLCIEVMQQSGLMWQAAGGRRRAAGDVRPLLACFVAGVGKEKQSGRYILTEESHSVVEETSRRLRDLGSLTTSTWNTPALTAEFGYPSSIHPSIHHPASQPASQPSIICPPPPSRHCLSTIHPATVCTCLTLHARTSIECLTR